MALVVLSPNYAYSAFCLDELSHILDHIKGKGRLVWPIFYDVNPSDVRWLEKGIYAEAMAAHEASSWCNTDRLQKWRNALHQVANFSGTCLDNRDKYLYEFIEEIVKEVSREIKPYTLPVADPLVGLESQMKDVKSLLNVRSDNEVHMVGIHGIGGIGKTTLALAVYNSIANQFERSCFLASVRENSEKHGLTHLQKIILSEIVGEKEIELPSVERGISIIQLRLRQKKVLLILDDVDKVEQLVAIAGEPKWFGPGSRVIITARDKGLLESHRVKSTYEMRELNKKDALELLRRKAFKSDNVSSIYADVLNRAATYASGLPLALEVIGSHLFEKGTEEWEYALDQYERIPDKKIQKVLEASFNTLEVEEKSVFLDIACCFKGYELAEVEKMLHAHHGYRTKAHIRVLVEKSLIKISESDNVTMHDLIEDMGKEIVRRESPEEPGKRSRLWYPKDIIQVLEENTGTHKVEIIYVGSGIDVEWDGEAFKKMENLKTLIIGWGHFSRSPKYLPNSLRILEWQPYPSSGLPLDFYPKKLSICKLTYCDFTSIKWGDLFKKKFENMRVLNLVCCRGLTKIPDVSGLPNLEEFSFQDCVNLITIDDSVGLLDKLKILRANCCRNLCAFPPLKLASLEQLHISYCGRLESFPPVEDGLMDKLKILRADHCQKLCAFPRLKLASLEQLHLSYCDSLESFPPVVDGLLDKLKILRADHCENLRSFPPLKLTSLEELNLSHCDSLESFPEMLGEVESITQLRLDKTPLKVFPFSFRNFTRLQTLYLRHCGIVQFPSTIVGMSKLTKLTIEGGGWLFPKLDEGEEKESPRQSSQVEFLRLENCHLSNESLAIGLKWFANVKELYLSGSEFTILPECIEKCHSLWKLVLDNCQVLEEIKGIPPSLKTFSACNCFSLTWSSRSKLLNQELLKGSGNISFLLPQAESEIPKWFDHQFMKGKSISFWFRNKFPAVALCVVSSKTWDKYKGRVRVIINGNTFFYRVDGKDEHWYPKMFHIDIFRMQMEKFNNNIDQALLENEWNHVVMDFGFKFYKGGIYVLNEKSSTKDVRFTKPL